MSRIAMKDKSEIYNKNMKFDRGIRVIRIFNEKIP